MKIVSKNTVAASVKKANLSCSAANDFLPDLRTEKEIFHLSNFTLEAVIVNQRRP
jgi:hypothetical protein